VKSRDGAGNWKWETRQCEMHAVGVKLKGLPTLGSLDVQQQRPGVMQQPRRPAQTGFAGYNDEKAQGLSPLRGSGDW
jgi:hypothetical protein